MPELSETDRVHCQARGARPGTTQFLVYRFSPEGLRDCVLSLQALVSEIRSILFDVSDPGVALAKLGWWQQELSLPQRVHSQHPVVRYARQSGLFDRIDDRDMNQLVTAAAAIVNGEAIPDRPALLKICRELGQAELTILLALESAEAGPVLLEELGTALGLVHFAERIHSTLPGERWWVPLQDQAKFGISFSMTADPEHREARSALLKSLADQAGEHLVRVAARDRRAMGKDGKILSVLFKVLEKRVNRVRSGSMSFIQRNSLGELWAAWFTAVTHR